MISQLFGIEGIEDKNSDGCIYIPVWWGYMFLILSEMHIYDIHVYKFSVTV